MRGLRAGALTLGRIILCLAAACMGPIRTIQAQPETVVRMEPSDKTLTPGEMVEVVIWVENAFDLYGAEVHLRFDPNVIQIEDAEPEKAGVQVSPGSFLDPSQGFVASNQADNVSGEIAYAVTLLAPASPVSGDGQLVRFTVTGTAPGQSDWHLETILANAEGAAIPTETQAAKVTVGDGVASPPPSPTSRPSPSTGTLSATSLPTAVPPTATEAMTAAVKPSASATKTPLPLQAATSTSTLAASTGPASVPRTEPLAETSTGGSTVTDVAQVTTVALVDTSPALISEDATDALHPPSTPGPAQATYGPTPEPLGEATSFPWLVVAGGVVAMVLVVGGLALMALVVLGWFLYQRRLG